MASINYIISFYNTALTSDLAPGIQVEQIHLFQAVSLHNTFVEVTNKKNKLIFEGSKMKVFFNLINEVLFLYSFSKNIKILL